MKFIVLLTAGIFLFSIINAQINVEGKTFNLVLKTILSSKVPAVSVSDAALNSNNYLFLDAREPEEYNISHLKNARFAGYKNFNIASLQNIPKNKPVIVYCAVGKRSQNITQKLIDAGYTNVHNLYGGIFEWVNEGHEVYNNANQLTDSVHAYSHFWAQFLNKDKKIY